jgi:cold-inducible RNA-binding protein
MAKNLYVGNLSYDTTSEGLRDAFAQYGEVSSVNVITDRETGRPRGFAFVEMSTEEGARAAVAGMNGQMLDGRQIKVAEAQPRQGGGGGGGGRGGGRSDRGGYGGGGSRW